MLVTIGTAGLLLVHRQTAVLLTGYRLTGLAQERDDQRERSRTLRIDIEKERHPRVLAERARTLGIELGQPAKPLFDDRLPGRPARKIITGEPGTFLKGEGR
jgi:hypothetical protein